MKYLTFAVLIAAFSLSGLSACTAVSGLANDGAAVAGAVAGGALDVVGSASRVGMAAATGAGNLVVNTAHDVNGTVQAATHPFPTTFP